MNIYIKRKRKYKFDMFLKVKFLTNIEILV